MPVQTIYPPLFKSALLSCTIGTETITIEASNVPLSIHPLMGEGDICTANIMGSNTHLPTELLEKININKVTRKRIINDQEIVEEITRQEFQFTSEQAWKFDPDYEKLRLIELAKFYVYTIKINPIAILALQGVPDPNEACFEIFAHALYSALKTHCSSWLVKQTILEPNHIMTRGANGILSVLCTHTSYESPEDISTFTNRLKALWQRTGEHPFGLCVLENKSKYRISQKNDHSTQCNFDNNTIVRGYDILKAGAHNTLWYIYNDAQQESAEVLTQMISQDPEVRVLGNSIDLIYPGKTQRDLAIAAEEKSQRAATITISEQLKNEIINAKFKKSVGTEFRDYPKKYWSPDFSAYMVDNHPEVELVDYNAEVFWYAVLFGLREEGYQLKNKDLKAFNSIQSLYTSLNAASEVYFSSKAADPTAVTTFETTSRDAIAKARKELAPYPEWREKLNMLLRGVIAVITVGVSLLVEAGIQKAVHGNFGFFGSHKDKMVKSLDNTEILLSKISPHIE